MKIKILLIALGLMTVLAGFQNCSNEITLEDVPRAELIVEILKTCNDAKIKGKLKTFTQDVSFPAQRPTEFFQDNPSASVSLCKFKNESWWGQFREEDDDDLAPNEFGNLTMKQDFLRGRAEQTVDIVLPENAIVCSAELGGTGALVDPQNPSEPGLFNHDDLMYLTYNDTVLVSSVEKSFSTSATYGPDLISINSLEVPFFEYDWASFINTSFYQINNNPSDYCLGESLEKTNSDGTKTALGFCTVPRSEVAELLLFQFEPEVFVPVANRLTAYSNNLNSSIHQVKLVIAGDNEPYKLYSFKRSDANGDGKEDWFGDPLDINNNVINDDTTEPVYKLSNGEKVQQYVGDCGHTGLNLNVNLKYFIPTDLK